MLESQYLASAAIGHVLSGQNLTQTLNDLWRKNPHISTQQRGAIQDLSYGVLRFYGELRAQLDLLLQKPLKDREIQCLLLVALYQLKRGKTASHTVVNMAVEAAKNTKPHASGLINGVLRSFLRKQEWVQKEALSSEIAAYNHPSWWIDKLKTQYPENYDKILKAGNEKPPMTLRINRRRISPEKYRTLLDEKGFKYDILSEVALKLGQPVGMDRLPGFSEGLVSVQDFGAQKAASFLCAEKGMRVLDACAAPGGKTAHLLESAEIELTSLDNNASRLKSIEETLSRLGLRATVLEGDASNPDAWWDGIFFDRILADVPCSASGVTKRHPDIKWLRRPGDIALFATQQSAILTALWQTLARGGKLLYATCSVFAEENTQVISDFIARHPDARRIPLDGDGQLLPNDRHDGFFYALLGKAD